MGYEIVVAILTLIGGGFGFPMGIPPGPEDPLMSQMAPDECVFYASWSGVGEIDPKANPTEKWLSQPKASKFISKAHKSYRAYLTKRTLNCKDKLQRLASQLVVEVIDAGSVQPVGMYIDNFGLEEGLKISGCAAVKLGDRNEAAVGLMNELHKSIATAEQKGSDFMAFEALEIEGEKAILIIVDSEDAKIFVTVRDGYIFIGVGKGSIEKTLANMKTPQPKWLEDLRERVKVDRVASVGFIQGTLIESIVESYGWSNSFSLPPRSEWLKEVRSIGWGNGLDSKGYVSHTEVRTEKGRSSLFGLVDHGSISKRDLEAIPQDCTFAFGTRISKEKVMELLRDSMRSKQQKEMYDEVLDQFEDLSGLRLEKEVFKSVGNYFYIYYDFSMERLWSGEGWVASLQIEDEMSFPEHLRQINKGVKKYADNDESIAHDVKEFEETEIHFVTTISKWYKYAWALVDDEWLFAKTPDEIITHLERRKKESQYFDRETVREIYEFGDKQGFGAPITIGHIDTSNIVEKTRSWIDSVLKQDSEILRGLDLKYTDIPPVDELINEVRPNFAAIFKTDIGYRIYQRQTYPGGTPPATLGAIAIASIPDQMGVAAVKQKLHAIAKAHLEFEKKHNRLPAPYSADSKGKKLLSWRVHLLPFLGHEDLYAEFRLDEAWDSEHNKKLVEKIPTVYQHPTMGLAKGKTAFVLPTNWNNVFKAKPKPGESIPLGPSLEEIIDKKAETVMVLEVQSSTSCTWTCPEDYERGALSVYFSMSRIRDTNYFVMAMCDGSVRSLPASGNYQLMRKIFDPKDKEEVKFPVWFFK